MMMKQYPRLRNILTSVFSIDVGLSESQEKSALIRAASSEEWKAAIKNELLGFYLITRFHWLSSWKIKNMKPTQQMTKMRQEIL
jgi:hypothetical protein